MTFRFLQRAPFFNRSSTLHPRPPLTARPSKPSTHHSVVDSLAALVRCSICLQLPTCPAVFTAQPEHQPLAALNSALLVPVALTRIRIARVLVNVVLLALSLARMAPNRLANVCPSAVTELIHPLVSCLALNVHVTATRQHHQRAVSPSVLDVLILPHSPTNRLLHPLILVDPNARPELILPMD